MKTRFRDEFDSFDTDMEIDETTVIRDLGIDPANIKNNVLQQIKSSKTKKNTKRLTVWLVAAAVSVAVVGTTVIATTGLLHSDFTPVYKGDVDALDVIDTSEFTFEAADGSLSAEFLGMICTEKNVIASVSIKKTDGTAFDTADGLLAPQARPINSYITLSESSRGLSAEDYLQRLRSVREKEDYPYVYFMQGRNNELYNTGYDDLYYALSDDGKTITVFISTPPLPGANDTGAVTLTSEYVYSITYNELICSFNTMNETVYNEADSLCFEKGLDMEKDCKWKTEDGRYCLYTITKNKLPLKFDLTYKVDYMDPEIITTVLDSVNSPMTMKPDRTADLTISPTRLSITTNEEFTPEQIREMQKTGQYKEDQLYENNDSSLNYEERISAFVNPPQLRDDHNTIDYRHSKIVLIDGTVKYFIADSSGLEWHTDKDTGSVIINEDIKLLYSDFFVDTDLYMDVTKEKLTAVGKTTVIDPAKIAKVVINSEVIYTKKGYEDIEIPDPDSSEVSGESSAPGLDITIPEKGRPDMKKYRPVQNSIEQINYYLSGLDGYYCTSSGITPYVNVDDDTNYVSTDILLGYEGTEEDLRDILYYLVALEEKNIFISSISFSKPNEDDIISMTAALINPYATPESGLTAQEAAKYILARWNSADRKKLIDRYFDTRADIEAAEFTIKLDKTMAEPEIPEPLYPSTIPSHKPEYKVDIEGYKYKKWTKAQLGSFAEGINDNIDVSEIVSNKDEDNGSFSSYQMTVHFNGTKEEAAAILKKITAAEKENLFIRSISVLFTDEVEYVGYEMEITIDNPYCKDESNVSAQEAEDYILSHYGSTDLAAAFDKAVGLYSDIHNVSDISMFIKENEDTRLPELIVSIHEKFGSYEDVTAYRSSFEKSDTFTLGEEFNIKKVPVYNDESKFLYDTVTTLRTDKFCR